MGLTLRYVVHYGCLLLSASVFPSVMVVENVYSFINQTLSHKDWSRHKLGRKAGENDWTVANSCAKQATDSAVPCRTEQNTACIA